MAFKRTGFSPKPAPGAAFQGVENSLPAFAKWVEQQFDELAKVLGVTSQTQYDKLNAAPAKPRGGMVVYADGTNWNPGAGEGIYAYYGGVWNKL